MLQETRCQAIIITIDLTFIYLNIIFTIFLKPRETDHDFCACDLNLTKHLATASSQSFAYNYFFARVIFRLATKL